MPMTNDQLSEQLRAMERAQQGRDSGMRESLDALRSEVAGNRLAIDANRAEILELKLDKAKRAGAKGAILTAIGLVGSGFAAWMADLFKFGGK